MLRTRPFSLHLRKAILGLMSVSICRVIKLSLFSWGEVAEEKLTDKISRKLITGKKVMVGQIFLKKGCIVASHKHESEQITYILKGVLEFSLPSGKITVGKDQVLVIPSNLEHGALALEDTIDMDMFSPIREDWLTGQDRYLRQDNSIKKTPSGTS
jgi:quercetin dioxygenase-like cupin family protein